MKKIDIYTTKECHHCHEAMNYFNSKNLAYTEHSVSTDPEARKFLMKKGIMSVPFIVIDDHEILGFNKEEIEKLIQL